MPDQIKDQLSVDTQSTSAPIRSDHCEKVATAKFRASNELAGELTTTQGPPEAPIQKAQARMVSQRKLLANRANGKRSTGPRSARGKAYSSRNSLKHGLLSNKTLFGPDGRPIDSEMRALWEHLRAQLNIDDERSQELLQRVVVECYHQKRALELEEQCLLKAVDDSDAAIKLDRLHRHRTASQRSLLKHLARVHSR